MGEFAMSTFEYLVKDLNRLVADQLQSQLAEFGNEGWELVSTFDRENGYRAFVFKRPTKPR
jgi:hypothetical protein